MRILNAIALLSGLAVIGSAEEYSLAAFSADVTVPIKHGMMGGAWLSTRIEDPLEARGIILLGAGKPIVVVSVDWCEIRNSSFDRWRQAIADAVETSPERVLVSTIHQHDAPVADVDAEQILRDRGVDATVCDPDFHELAVGRVARSATLALSHARRITHLGMGEAEVEKIASNRRYVTADGSVRFDRMSRTTDPAAVSADRGVVDPILKTLSFWDGDTPVAAISAYAVHPMSYYGQGEVSADFPGLARRRRSTETPGVHQMYVTGCAGNVVAGKYNDGSPRSRIELADRLHSAMSQAWQGTKRVPLEAIRFRQAAVRFEPRVDDGFSRIELEAQLTKTAGRPFDRCLSAMGLAWRKRLDDGHRVQVPCIDFGVAVYLVLPGEAYVEYQIAAQNERPGDFVVVAGYGEAGTGYIPTEAHIEEKDSNLGDWWWVAPGSEALLRAAIREVLRPDSPDDP